jgi:hypothetical protein
MWCVPIKNDIIKTTDGIEFAVIEYSNFKDKGPVVYCKHDSVTSPIYFFDIAEINDIKVSFNTQSKILEALGNLKRKIHLPQKHDKITVLVDGEELIKKVANIKLHSRSIGLSKGMLIIDSEGDHYSLQQIIDIKRPIGDHDFDQKKFKKIYHDYLGYKH